MLANSEKFDISGSSQEERETAAWNEALKLEKTAFALHYAILDTEWIVPLYIKQGLRWLAGSIFSTADHSAPILTLSEETKESPDV